MRARRWRRLRQAVGAHPGAVDTVMAVAIAVMSVLQGFDVQPGRWRAFDTGAVVLTVLATLPVAARRRAPVTALLVAEGFWCLLPLLDYPPAHGTYGILLALYTVAATRPWPWTAFACAVSGALWVFGGVVGGQTPVVTLVAQGAVVSVIVWWLGDVARRLAEGNRRLAAAGEELARRAVVEERVRIARELHDVVAHHLSVVAVQAGLARFVLRSDPDTAEAALRTVLDTDREALHELRRVLELLRLGAPAEEDGAPDRPLGPGTDDGRDADDGSRFTPAPRLARLPDLAERVRAAGVPVTLVVTGAPRTLAPGLELCAYRVVQESLTNVIKHAGPATATVTVEYAAGELRVTVADDGRNAVGNRVVGRGGHGLRGMRERAMLYGGTLRAGPRTGGGFDVRLVLPVRPP